MMKRTLLFLSAVIGLLLAFACERQARWPSPLHPVEVRVVYPEGYTELARAGVRVVFSMIASSQNYVVLTDENGCVSTSLPTGIYRVKVSDKAPDVFFNGLVSRCLVNGECRMDVPLIVSKASPLLIRELYVGGCSKAPKEGTYQSDQYVLLHNNFDAVYYLDSLCFGTLSPYNSTAVNRWMSEDGRFPAFAPVTTVVWRFPGNGHSFPLRPGEDALIALRGAIDHTQEYPLSVNLNRSDCFVCYNPTYFPNTLYHPAPGDQIRQDHILDVVIKTGQANANTISVSSPTFLIFKAKGTSIEEWVSREDAIAVTPGNSSDVVVKVPWEWVLDAVEVFNGASSGNTKRLPPDQDAGFVYQTEPFKGYVLTRYVDEQESTVAGFTVLMDSNNSNDDFYQSSRSLLRP